MRKRLDYLISLIFLYVIIAICWQFAELISYGNANPNGIDSIVALFLSISIYENIKSNSKEGDDK